MSIKVVGVATAAAIGELLTILALWVVKVLGEPGLTKSSLWFQPTYLFWIAASGHAAQVRVKVVGIATAATIDELLAIPALWVVEVHAHSSSAISLIRFEPTKLFLGWCDGLLPISELKLVKDS